MWGDRVEHAETWEDSATQKSGRNDEKTIGPGSGAEKEPDKPECGEDRGGYNVGSTVFGNWTIKRKIGEGAFGAVYEINREDFGETYRAAMKVITVPSSDAEIESLAAEGMSAADIQRYYYSSVEDLVREFAIMAKLKATGNIVSYEDHTVIKHKDGIGWDILIRMELLNPLLPYAYQHPFTRRDVIRLGIDICKALELCQKYNVIHRDIKPENIFVTDNGDFKLGDFGIARTIEKTQSALSSRTGTLSYMAPEVYLGKDYGFNVDTYSLGIVLYRLLNRNRTPFLPAPPEPITVQKREAALAKRMNGEKPPAPFYARGRLAEIVLKACAFDPRDRYSSPMQMRQELEAILYAQQDAQLIYPDGDEVSITPNRYIANTEENSADEISADERTRRGTKHKIWPAMIAVLLILIAAAGIGGVFYVKRAQEAKQTQYLQLLEQAQQCRDTRPETALALYLQAQGLFPEEESPYVAYAYTLYSAQDYDACISYVENDLALGKNFSADSQSQLSEILGAAYFEKDDYAAAASFFRLSTAGGDLTVNAMRDYAVSLGRLGDISAANEVLSQMIKAGATDDVTAYVQAEIHYAQKSYLMAEEGFKATLNTAENAQLLRRALRSLAELYRDCTLLDYTGESPINRPAKKEVDLLMQGIPAYHLEYDSSLTEMLAMAWFEAYKTDAEAAEEYLVNSAEWFQKVLDMGIQKDYLYTNLYTIYYELTEYQLAEGALEAYETVFPNDYTPHALRAILLITLENEKAQDERDYSQAYKEFQAAGNLMGSSDDQTYYQQLESLIRQLQEKGWLN